MATEFHPITGPLVKRVLAGKVASEFIRCTALTGFAIRNYGGKASYIVEARVGRRGGKSRRVTIGRVGRMSLDDAKAVALKTLAALANGVDPVVAAKREKVAGTTLQQALDDMLAARQSDYKPSTVEDYRRSLKPLSAWAKRPLAAITGPQIKSRYEALAGHSAKGRTFRVLRTVWHFAKGSAEAGGATFPPFPGGALREARKGWATAPRKRRRVPDTAMPEWKRAILTLREDVRDYILILLYTGMRSIEARNLTAKDVNLGALAFTLRDTKVRRDLDLPITTQLLPVFERRIRAANAGDGRLFDFGGIWREWEPTRSICEWSPHDLRRGYASMAHRLSVDEEITRALIGHAVKDAHGGYVIFTADDLRPEAQRIADALDRLATASPVVSLVEQQQAA